MNTSPSCPVGRRVAAAVLGVGLLLAGPASPPTLGAQAAEGEPLLVLAASSLTDVLPRAAAGWGGPPVRFSFDATSRLARQVVAGTRADVFVSADRRWMAWLRERGSVVPGSERVLAGNELVVVVPAGAPRPSSLDALAGVERLALAGENVPAGRYAREALASAGVWDAVAGRVVRGGSVRGALEWVARGEVDAGVVYRTDAVVEPGVDVAFALPADGHEAVAYPAAVLAGSDRPGPAQAFLDHLAGDEAAAAFRSAGFGVSGGGPASAAEAGTSAPASEGAQGRTARPDAPPAVPDVAVDPWSAVGLSLVVALLATVVGLVPAVGLGWLLARRDFPGKTLLSTAILAPLVVPPVVTGFLLLTLLGSNGPLGPVLASVGVTVPFTLVGATLAAFAVGLPLYVLAVRGAFDSVDPHYEEVSLTLGVPPARTFRRITLPLALPGIAAGAVLAFARALGEFGATVVLAGNVEGSTRTIALAVYTLLESPEGREATWVLVGASLALSLAALAGYEALSRWQRGRTEVRGGR